MPNPVLDAFSSDPGVDAGRIAPSGVTPANGDFVFCLGHDAPGFTAFLKPGDYVEVTQTDVLPAGNLLTFAARGRPPKAALGAGYSWVASLRVDGSEVATRTISESIPIDWEWAYDLTGVSGSHAIAFRLTFTGPSLPGPPGLPIVEVEIPAFYIDALTFSTSGTPIITNEIPVANQGISDGSPPADNTGIDFDIFGEGSTVDPTTLHVTVNAADAIVGGVAQAGFTATIGSPGESVHVRLAPTTPFSSNELVTIAATVSTGGSVPVAPTAMVNVNASIALGDASGGSTAKITVAASAGLTGAYLTDGTTHYPLTGISAPDGTHLQGTVPAIPASATLLSLVVQNASGDSPPLANAWESFWPTNISGCIQWLRGDLGITQSGGVVHAWSDQSGSGFPDMTDAVGHSPLAPISGINGKLAIPFAASRYAGAGDSLGLPSSSPAILTSCTSAEAFVVAQETTSTNTGFWFYGQGSAGFYPFSGVVYENFGITSRPDSGSNPGGGSLPSATSPWFYNPRAATTTFDLFINGQHMIAATGTTVGFPTFSVQVGYNGLAFPMTGIINELILYNKILSSGERTRVTAYKADRYGF